MILSAEERKAALDGALQLLNDETFDIQHVEVLRAHREVPSMIPGTRKYFDTGVVTVLVSGVMPPFLTEDYGPEVSENADEFPFEIVDPLDLMEGVCEVCGLIVTAQPPHGFWFHNNPSRNVYKDLVSAKTLSPHQARVDGAFRL